MNAPRNEYGALLNLLLEAERAGARLLAAWVDELPPQAWVARRIAAALPEIASPEARRLLSSMHQSHVDNIVDGERLLGTPQRHVSSNAA